MTYLKSLSLNTANATGTAFGRLRTAGEGNRLDAEFEYDKRSDLYDEVQDALTAYKNGTRPVKAQVAGWHRYQILSFLEALPKPMIAHCAT